VQKSLGYASTGLTTEQVLFFLYGSGANGKTTLLDAVMYALGDYAGKADRDLLTAREGAVHPTNVADLMGRRLVVCSETNEGTRLDEAKLKDLVGESRLKARFMRQDFFEFNATHKVFLYSNHKPMVRGTDFGFWRRMRLVPFVETIGDEEKDRDLPAKLQAEADGILAWLVEGCGLWRGEGLGTPDEVAKATEEYRQEMDSIGAFLSECCEVNTSLQAAARDLYGAYTGYCEDVGEKPLSQKRLGAQLRERGLVSHRDSYSGRTIWRGIGLKATAHGI
jgi:putative DNA primase/helicase